MGSSWLLAKKCTTLQSNDLFELENVLKAEHQDLTPVKQPMKYTALQPLNEELLFFPGLLLNMNCAVLLPPGDKFEPFTDPQLMMLNNRKPDIFWPYALGFGIPADDVFSSSTPKHRFNFESVFNRLVLCNNINLHDNRPVV